MTDAYQKVFAGKERILFVFSHPDDAEIYCGGTIARLVADGKKIQLVKMTTGNKGSRQEKMSERELAQIREEEDIQALKTLGLQKDESINLDLGDGQIENSLATIEKLVHVIRTFKPDLIVTHNPEKVLIRDLNGGFYVNHRDHRNTATSVIDAAYPYSRDLLFFPQHIQAGLSGHSVTEFLFVDSWGDQDSVAIEITDFSAQRTTAIACHSSQYSPENAQASTDFFAPETNGQRFEQFRYVKAD